MNGEMRIIDKTGDTRIIWDSNNPDEVENARRTFDDLKKKGYMAYSVEKGGTKGELITKFDPQAEKLIMAPRQQGG